MTTLGITVVQSATAEVDRAVAQGSSVALGGYDFRFEGTKPVEGPNYSAIEGTVVVGQGGKDLVVLHPQKRTYWVQQNPMTEASISARLDRDLFVAMGEDVGRGAWSLRMQVRPLIQLVWLGAFIMMLGGIVSGLDRRYRVPKEARETVADAAAAGQSA
jgi:cytochrome c-type biogenesis protein CcmF